LGLDAVCGDPVRRSAPAGIAIASASETAARQLKDGHPMTALTTLVLPESKRRDPGELRDRLDLDSGDSGAKRSAFWLMLTLAGVIATAGVLTDSTATVIGAMIIAPLSTPIMGSALAIVTGRGRAAMRALGYVLLGVVLVIGIGVVGSLAVPSGTDLLDNSQIAGRTAPGLFDLAAALATGIAGAIGLSRTDVGDVLPGVAIAISLVPPLGVVGVCLGRENYALALGAFVLFASNVLAMVIAGSAVFTLYGFGRLATIRSRFGRARAYLGVGALVAVALVPLGINTTTSILVTMWTDRAHRATEAWLESTPGADVQSVRVDGRTTVIEVRVPGALPSTAALLTSLRGKLPGDMRIELDTTSGEHVELGRVR
jgi:uncharacterized hydrophobic protein (TIGR00271 family)